MNDSCRMQFQARLGAQLASEPVVPLRSDESRMPQRFGDDGETVRMRSPFLKNAQDELEESLGGELPTPRITSGDRVYVEIHFNRNTFEVRHCFSGQGSCLRFHAGFTEADEQAGWYQALATSAGDFDDMQLHAIKARLQAVHEAASTGAYVQQR